MNISELIDHYQEWVDYDMKRYGKISDETNRDIREAGLQIVKDKYGDYEVIAGRYNESLKSENSWIKRWNFLDNYYKGDLVISKISSPCEAWHIEKVDPNGHTIKHLGNYKSLKAAMDAAEQYLIKNESKSIENNVVPDKSINESNDAVYDMYKKQYKNLLQDIKYVLNSDNIEDIRAYDKEGQGEYILSKLFDSRMNKRNMSFEDAKEDVIDFLYRTRADAKSELELRNKRSLESKSIMNKVKSELSKDYKLVSESENALYFKASDNSTHDDCIAFVDKVVAVSGGKYAFTGRGGSWTQWDILTPEGSHIKAGYDYSNKDNYAVYFKSILTESRSTRSTSKESVDKSLKEPLSELATHCVYFTQDGIEQIEFEGSEDECNQYIADIQAEQDDEFGNEAPERFIKRLHEKMFILGESISPEYKMVEYTYDGDELSDYLGHVRVRTDSDKVALHAAEEYVMNKQFERNPRHFKICNDSYNNVDVIDSYGDFLTRLESVTESESYEDMYKYVVEYTFYNVKKSVIYDKRHGHDYAETPEDAEALFQKYVKMAEARGYDSIFVKIARPIFLGTSLIDSDAIKIYSDGEIIKDNMIDESLKEAKKLRAPKFWNTRFADNVIKDYEAGKLTFDNIEEWDTAYNDGRKPNPPFNTKEILDYYLATKRKAMFAKGYKGENYQMKLKIRESAPSSDKKLLDEIKKKIIE